MKIPLLFSLSAIVMTAYPQVAPPIDWQKTFGGNASETGYCIRPTSDGGYIIAGDTYSSNGDVSANHGVHDFWIIKTDGAGNLLWEKNYGGANDDFAYEINVTSDGGFIVAGRTFSDDGDVTGFHGGVYDAWVLKLDNAGDLEWQKTYGAAGNEDAFAAQQTSDGGYIIAGSAQVSGGDVGSVHGGGDFWLIKTDAAGSIIWEETYGGTDYELCFSLTTASDGGYVMAGLTYSSDGDVEGFHGYSDVWVIKTNDTGELVWQASLGGVNEERANHIEHTDDGGYIVAGFASSEDGDVSEFLGAIDYWVVKLNADGIMEWEESIGGASADEAYEIQQTGDGGYVIAGSSMSNNVDVSGNHGLQDYWVAKLDNEGSIIWSTALGGSALEVCNSLCLSVDGSVVLAGWANSDDGDVTDVHDVEFGDYWIVKLEPSEDVKHAIQNAAIETSIGPNPFSDHTQIRFDTPLPSYQLEVTNEMGQMIVEECGAHATEILIERGDMKNGIYFFSVKSEGQTIVCGKLIVE